MKECWPPTWVELNIQQNENGQLVPVFFAVPFWLYAGHTASSSHSVV